jgi:uncharacterized membrane protein YhaH (DUF805 family)
MKGNVIGFDPDSNTGAISGHDGRRYDFVTQDWHGRGRPKHGALVDFASEGEQASRIYLVEPEYRQPSLGTLYFSARGRISRSQYWLKFLLPGLVISVVLGIIGGAVGGGAKMLPNLFGLLSAWPGIALLIKRIHDRNKSGSLVWVSYGPFIGAMIFTIAGIATLAGGDSASVFWVMAGVFWIIVVGVGIWFFIEFGCMRGTIGANRYGPDPATKP